jgi:DHA2 family multidrug resistance protein
MWVQIVRGLFLGFSFMTVTVLGMSNVPPHKISRASALNNTIRQVSGSFGIAVLSTVLQNRQIFHLSHIADSLNNTSSAALSVLQTGQNLFAGGIVTPRPVTYIQELSIPHHKAMIMLNGIGQQHSVIFAFDDAFWVLGIFALAGVLIALLLKPAKSNGKHVAVID